MEIPAGFAQANFRFGGPAVPTGAEMTMGLDIALWGSSPTALATALAADWTTAVMAGLQTNKIGLTQIEVKFGPTATGPSGIWAGSINGTKTGDGAPPATCALISKLTAFGGRSGKGRWYLPGLAESDINNSGQLENAFITGANVALLAFLNAVEARDVTLVILHNPGSPLTIPTPIDALIVQQQVATQRRRNRR